MVRFDPADGSKPTQAIMKTGTLATPPQHNPQRDGFRFDGWTRDGQPYDFQDPILQDTTLTAKWSKATDWRLSPDHGPASGALLTITPPDRQEPYYTGIRTAGDQTVGVTGDGRIYTWKQGNTPQQVPTPAQASGGFRYLQAAAGSHWQAALGSDQHIYTWASQQLVPTLLHTGQDAEFTSISMNGDLLLAVDRQGQVHAYQAIQADSQNPNPKPAAQEAISLPGQAQAVLAVTSGSRILIVDTDGQAWTRETNNTGKAKPEPIKQEPGTRIVQAQALNQGVLLLDADGQAYHLANSKTSLTAVNLSESMKARSIATNHSRAVITDTDGRLWVWQTGDKPMRADKGSQPYTQAAATSDRIIALDRQGYMFTWSLDEQGQPGKPTRINATVTSTLESASMDGQTLTLSKKDNSWQTEAPAHKPGPAAITLAGRQDGQPFTRSLSYTVDQTLTRDDLQRSTYKVTFNADGGNPEPADQNFSTPNSRVKRPSPDPTREGYLFDGWFTGEVAYDFSRPVTENLTITAKWTFKDPNNTWSISPDKGSQLGNESTIITPPDITRRNIRFSQVSGSKNDSSTTYGFSLAVGSDGNAYAWGDNRYGQLGDGTTTERHTPVRVRTPDRETYPDLPADFTYVQVSAGSYYSLALGSDGYVYAWGYNHYGQLGNKTKSDSSKPIRVRDPANPDDESKGLQATQVSAGYSHSLAVGSDGYAYAWGYNEYGKLGNNTSDDLSDVPVQVRDPADVSKGLQATQVDAGWRHSLAIGTDGYAYAWGYNKNGQLGNGKTSSTNANPVPVHVRDPANPDDESKGLQATQVSAGYSHSLAVGSDGYAYAWGFDYCGQLGNNSTTDSTVPVHVRDPANPDDESKGLQATQVDGGYEHSLALGSDGYAYAWGENDKGQLGNNTTSGYYYPVKVLASEQSTSKAGPWLHAVRIIAGDQHSLAIDTDGNTKAWGRNDSGRLGDGTTNNKSAPVPVVFNLQLVITGVRFDQTPVSGLTRGDDGIVTVLTPEHLPGTVTVSVDYTLVGATQKPDTSLRYTYLPAGTLPEAGGEGILLILAAGTMGIGGVLASSRHRRERHQLLHASHE
ncbi:MULTISPECIES: RCC1 domain-containing protein [Bifidobacterium]|uniref:RCC1 domain-containing protein n=1 Tax=Bifidobacterium TaxID=1678 RepID=UPI001E64838B|nr:MULTISPECIES: InlB B-repeat-containing protein [Bifidobacterium]